MRIRIRMENIYIDVKEFKTCNNLIPLYWFGFF